MTKALPICLLVLALFGQAQGYSGRPRLTAITGSEKPFKSKTASLLSTRKQQPAQDTAKGSGRLLTSSQLSIAAAWPRIAPSPANTQELVQPNSTESVSTEETTGFNPETANLPGNLAITLRRPAAPLGRRTFRTRLVRTSRWASHSESVEILTCTYAGPLVLAQLPATGATPAQVVAGPGNDPSAPLRPLELTQDAVLRLCGDHAPQVRAYAMLYDLHFQQANEVARLLDYYNRIAIVKE